MKHTIFMSIGAFLSFSLLEIISYDGNLENIAIYIIPLIVSALCYFLQMKIKTAILIPIASLIYSVIRFTMKWRSGFNFDLFATTAIIYFILMIVFTISFNEVKQNEVIGIRTSATLKYKEVWDRSHKLTSYVFALFLPFSYTTIFLDSGWLKFILTNITVLMPCIIGFIISHIVAKPFIESDYKRYQDDLERQLKLEEEGKLK